MGTPGPLTPDSLLTLPEARALLRIGNTHLYKLIGQGRIWTLKLGSRTLVPYREILRLIREALEEDPR
ncbi:helix-turn-helix domain-containing protein [Mycobacterium sp. 141]|uniref:helix-turn-helix domain-containing protein n=1 Tax=Mycobacterium sp. 141 TaxID=1120797 RepID=UPI00037B4D13|nr:helix-turn-helix domain-containing protein [Mycobacterium sp. 141]